jgi:hypothetical protein
MGSVIAEHGIVADTGAIVGDTEIEEIPVLGRRSLPAELTPAVDVVTRDRRPQRHGSSASQSRVVIDGFDHTDSLTGEPEGHEARRGCRIRSAVDGPGVCLT